MEIASYLIVGAIVSLVVQGIKKFADTSGWKAIAITIVVSLVAGAVYNFFANTVYWQVLLQILAYSSAVYALLIKQVHERIDE